MEYRETRGEICLDGPCGLVYRIADITFTIREDDSFRYVVCPDYPVIDLLEPPLFQGIPGFDLSKRRDGYIRDNITPTFISERVPSENREDLWKMLADAGMDHFNKLEWLIRTDKRYIGDGLYVRRPEARQKTGGDVLGIVTEGVNTENSLRRILSALCQGETLTIGARPLPADERKTAHDLLLALYMKSWSLREARRLEGVKRASQKGAYLGRRRTPLDELVLHEVIARYKDRKISADEAAESLGISKSTLYRRMRESRPG